MFEFLGRYLLIAMEWINHTIISNYALAVVVFTAVLKLITVPFDIKQRKAMAKVSALAPETAKIQKRYEANPEVAQKKVSELYKKNNASPYASCLPMIITLLFFMVFFRAMTFWSHIGTVDIFLSAKEHTQTMESNEPTEKVDLIKKYHWGKIGDKKWLVNNIWMPDSGFSPVIMKYEQFAKIPFDKLDLYFDQDILGQLSKVSEKEYNKAMDPLIKEYSQVNNGYFIFPVLSVISMLAMQFIQQKLNPQQNAQGQPGMGKGMMIFMSLFSGYICLQSNMMFGVYWLSSNIFSLIITLILHYTGVVKPTNNVTSSQ